MRPDQPIDEDREVRRRISARFDHDPTRLVAFYQKLHEHDCDRLNELAKTTKLRHD